ncbi:2-phosphosulfolactate phosphatase [Bacillus massilinigeriensis]|uniref:2-phosphosulfolactate phosphatase n=1 Tax=Bacillus mediterraneensis TaxID=1805474 RepID=UPI0008F91B93|nr:2-phosphosulfolactate phosphatase [Bacillus mediterraneensis]
MNVSIIQGNSVTPRTAEVNVVIDVIRAFTVAHHAFLLGAKEIILSPTVEASLELKQKNRDFLLAGEVEGLPIAGFDLDNSPWNLQGKMLDGKTIVQKTTNGVKAALNALDAEIVLVTGFSNAKVTADYIRSYCIARNTDCQINLVASHPTGDEDLACAEYIAGLILGDRGADACSVSKRIKNSVPAQKFFDPKKPEFQQEDICLCTEEINKGFVMKVNTGGVLPRIERVEV